jgi:RNA polymerase sigma-70 factor (ECF subfamily)
VFELLSHLPDDRRAAFALTQVLGLSYEDAGRICHCPPGIIGSRVARARAELVEAFSLVDHTSTHTDAEVRPDAMD